MKQSLSSNFNTTGSDEMIGTSKVFVKKMTALASKRTAISWTTPARLLIVQIFPVSIMYLAGNVHKDAMLPEKCWHSSVL